MKQSFFTLLCLLSMASGMAQDKPAYSLFSSKGKSISYKKAMNIIQKGDVICFGELHNNPIAHWLEFEILQDLVQQKGADQMVVGAEMFETDQQTYLNAYLAGKLSSKDMADSTRLWPNYDTDYQPVVRLCKAENIPFIATNAPRSYARVVAMEGMEGLDSISEDEKALLTPVPFEIDYDLPSYSRMKDMVSGHGHGMSAENFIAAQAIKDATMAHFILKNKKEDQTFYHVNGSYHSDDKEGILWYVSQQNPELNLVNLTVVEQSSIEDLEEEFLGKADVIIAVPENMTKTYLTRFE